MLHIAVQDAAEAVNGGGVQGLVFTELVDGGAGEVVVLDQGVGGLAGCAERFSRRGCRRSWGTSGTVFFYGMRRSFS